jgi:Cu+-exporting ATPase
MSKTSPHTAVTSKECSYCGQSCAEEVWNQDKVYCCHGCLTLSLTDGDFSSFIDEAADQVKYKHFDLVEVFDKTVDFQDDKIFTVSVKLPEIHCSSCVQVLEDLPAYMEDVLHVKVNFEAKQALLKVKKSMSLSTLFHVLDKIGYPPQVVVDSTSAKDTSGRDNLIKLAIAGFAFGNIMLFSMPHYLGLTISADPVFAGIFRVLNSVLSILSIYAGGGYLVSAWKAAKHAKAHIDVPIALGILALWGWSIYEIWGLGQFGYMDSLAGLVFFLLIGKWFQSKVYEKVSFERSINEFMPMMVRKQTHKNGWVRVQDLELGDVISVKNEEIVPVNATLLSDLAHMDYSFVTGESRVHEATKGNKVYVGAKVIGSQVNLVVSEKPNISKLWSAWKTPKKKKDLEPVWSKKVSKYFTFAVLILAVLGGLFWMWFDPTKAVFVSIAVLIVACPCALALSAPFTYGAVWNAFTKNGFFLKSSKMVGVLSEVGHVVFDKTGTLTHAEEYDIQFKGETLSDSEKSSISTVAQQSNHPLSQSIHKALGICKEAVLDFQEFPGKGILAQVNGHKIEMGSAAFLGLDGRPSGTEVHVRMNGAYKGVFQVKQGFRKNLKDLLGTMTKNLKVSVLSGDVMEESAKVASISSDLHFVGFEKSPQEKRDFIRSVNQEEHTMMVGDGLNDQIAIKESDMGVVVAQNVSGFYPSADGVLLDGAFGSLSKFMQLSSYSTTILKWCLGFSLIYNIIGLSYALSGVLTPLVAAILMPISSITVVLLSTSLVKIKAKKLGLK